MQKSLGIEFQFSRDFFSLSCFIKNIKKGIEVKKVKKSETVCEIIIPFIPKILGKSKIAGIK